MLFPWFLCAVLLVAVFVLFLKIMFFKRSMDEICTKLKEHLINDTNTLISVSTSDKHIKHFAAQLNRQLRLLRRQRRQYLNGGRELKEAVINISHDLRTPLTAICGYLELLDREQKPEPVHRYLNIINNRVELLKQLTEELFQSTVLMESENQIVKEKIILNEMLEESISGFYAALKERSIEPNVQMPGIKVIRQLNASILSRVLSNLLNNAIKYSDGDLEITLSEAGEITFTNTASGLSQLQVEKFFDRFYTVATASKSTGLGLEITRLLVEQMNGTISANYDHNKLSICILFPDMGG